MTTLRLLFALLALTLTATLALAQEKPAVREAAPPKVETDDGEKAEAPKSGATVTLLEAGEEPRRELRYEGGGEARIVLTLREISEQLIMGMRPPATRTPEVRYTIESKAGSAGDEDDLKVQLRFVEVEVVPDPNVPPPALQVTQRNVRGVKGRSVEIVASNRGVVRSMTMDGPAGRPGAHLMGDAVAALRETVRSMLVLLPEEPVGVGARWRVEMTGEAGGIDMKQRIVFTLTGIKDGAFTLDVESSRTAADQQIQMPGSPQTMALRTLESSGKGSVTVALSQVLPARSRGEEKTEMDMAISGPGGTHTLLQTIESWTSVSPAPTPEKEETKEDVE